LKKTRVKKIDKNSMLKDEVEKKKKQVKCTSPSCIRLLKKPIHVGIGRDGLLGPLFIFVF
jgi:hypothetical protein